MGKHIPGTPRIPINMPGGGGIRAANYMAQVAPQDGTLITIVSQGLPSTRRWAVTELQADLRDFHWIGNLVYSTSCW